jgi:hypothetical protein|tara:strand:+ start:852 stop:1181 length:330 start_codon:yes stop_codon:yes gene_type:complete
MSDKVPWLVSEPRRIDVTPKPFWPCDPQVAGSKKDMVDHPAHYNASGIECIDAMKAMSEKSSVDAHAAYCWQNCFKYLWRWPYKNGLEDLKKARWYLDRLISEVENGRE